MHNSVTGAHVCCIISSKTVEKYSRLNKSKKFTVKEENNTDQFRFQLIAQTVADVMAKAGVSLNNIIIAGDGLAAVLAHMFRVEMEREKKGFFKKAKNIFGM